MESSVPLPGGRRGRWVVILLLAIGVVSLFAALYKLSTREGGKPEIQVAGANDAQVIFGGVRSAGDRLGSSDAPVSIQYFNDVQCSNCGDEFLSVIPPLVETEVRNGDIQLLYRNYSFSLNPVQQGFIADVAAGIQGYEWTYVYLLFRNQGAAEKLGQVSDDLLLAIANSIYDDEFKVGKWKRDFSRGGGPDGPITKSLQAEDDTARGLGLRAEPSAIVNGPNGTVTLQDSPDLDQVRAAIDQVD